MARFKLSASTPYVNSTYHITVEIDDDDLEGYDQITRDHIIEDIMHEELWKLVQRDLEEIANE